MADIGHWNAKCLLPVVRTTHRSVCFCVSATAQIGQYSQNLSW